MPRIRTNTPRARPGEDWEQVIVDQIRTGKVLPIVSNALHNDLLLGGHRALAERFAAWLRYPLSDCHDLARVTQFETVLKEIAGAGTAVKRDYLAFAKSLLFELAEAQGVPQAIRDDAEAQFDELGFSDLAAQLGRPAFGDPADDPMLILAELPLPIYLTTSFHSLLEAALTRAGKTPRTALCRWRPELETLDDPFDGDYQPTRQEPLVYHLYGLDRHPESLVLTEDDHLAFLVGISRDPELIPLRLRQAITESSLILLGYDLREADFRSLLWGLIRPRPVLQQGVCVLQVRPGAEEQRYVDRYLDEVAFKVSWGSFEDYVRSLQTRLRPAMA